MLLKTVLRRGGPGSAAPTHGHLEDTDFRIVGDKKERRNRLKTRRRKAGADTFHGSFRAKTASIALDAAGDLGRAHCPHDPGSECLTILPRLDSPLVYECQRQFWRKKKKKKQKARPGIDSFIRVWPSWMLLP